MSKNDLMGSLHLHTATLAAVMAGEADQRTSVGIIQSPDGTNEILANVYVHFEKDSGKARVSPKGRLRLNIRRAATKEQRATSDLNKIAAVAKPVTAAQVEDDLDESPAQLTW